jgi:hypothetical protein
MKRISFFETDQAGGVADVRYRLDGERGFPEDRMNLNFGQYLPAV